MSDPTLGPLKPQDTIVFLLGEMKGELRAIREGQAAAAVSHAASDAENKKEHEEFRKSLGDHASDLAVLKSSRVDVQISTTQRLAFWTSLIGVPAALGSVIYLATLIINHP